MRAATLLFSAVLVSCATDRPLPGERDPCDDLNPCFDGLDCYRADGMDAEGLCLERCETSEDCPTTRCPLPWGGPAYLCTTDSFCVDSCR